jgi:hypothetical protein
MDDTCHQALHNNHQQSVAAEQLSPRGQGLASLKLMHQPALAKAGP